MALDSSSALEALKQPIAIRPECVSSELTTISVQQKAAWSKGDFIAKARDGNIILTSSGKVLSNSARQEFFDGSGLPLFSLRRSWISLTRHFWLELPGGNDILTVIQKWSVGKIKLDFTVRGAMSQDHREVVLELRGEDRKNQVTSVFWGEQKVALIKRKTPEHKGSSKFLPEYDADLAEGMDTALISVMVVVMADLIQNRWDTQHPQK